MGEAALGPLQGRIEFISLVLFCNVSEKRDVRDWSFELRKDLSKFHCKYVRLYWLHLHTQTYTRTHTAIRKCRRRKQCLCLIHTHSHTRTHRTHTCPPSRVGFNMTVSAENATPPKSTKSRNSNRSVHIQIKPKS